MFFAYQTHIVFFNLVHILKKSILQGNDYF